MRGIDKLTAPQLEMAAADLRNARLVVKHAGHFRNSMVSMHSGEVCALAAIHLATCYKRLAYIEPARQYIILPLKRSFDMDDYDARMYRMENAVVAFADTIPSRLCPACHASVRVGVIETAVVHYNDDHCPSGEILQNMLGLAADKAMDRAAEKRSLVGGRLLASV